MSRAPRDASSIRARERGLPPTPVQLRAIDLVSRGLPVAAVAARLGVSYDTAKTHLSRLYARLDVAGAPQAVRVCLELGLLETRPATEVAPRRASPRRVPTADRGET